MALMETEKSIQVVLEATLDGGTIAGSVQESSGRRLDFTGWLGLVAAIDAAARGLPPSGVRDELDLLNGGLEP